MKESGFYSNNGEPFPERFLRPLQPTRAYRTAKNRQKSTRLYYIGDGFVRHGWLRLPESKKQLWEVYLLLSEVVSVTMSQL
jgi:hypothetical protein